MAGRGIVLFLCLLFLAACTSDMRAQVYSAVLQDNGPRKPFAIAPGLFYVGSSDIAVYAIDTGGGLIVINSGYQSTARQVITNLRILGYAPHQVKILLNTHAHMDHAAGMARLKQQTGARLLAHPDSASLLEAGGRGDFFLGDWMTFPRVRVDEPLHDGKQVTLGNMTLTAHFTPGHTKGCTSWSFPIVVDGRERQALIVCSLATLLYQLVGKKQAYTGIDKDFEASFKKLRSLKCDLFLSDHANFFNLETKRTALEAGAATNPFLDSSGCAAFLDERKREFRDKVRRQGGK
jgi:metallo-beta-lactamase class B